MDDDDGEDDDDDDDDEDDDEEGGDDNTSFGSSTGWVTPVMARCTLRMRSVSTHGDDHKKGRKGSDHGLPWHVNQVNLER